MDRNVITQTLDKGVCCGCGVCKDVCPVRRLDIRMTDKGLYAVCENAAIPCLEKCVQCLKVCPFSKESDDATQIAERLFPGTASVSAECGRWLNCYEGYVADEAARIRSASGGLLTAVLKACLREKKVDFVLCVGATGEKPIFAYKVCRTEAALDACVSSKYYPVALSDIETLIKNESGICAVVALPCTAKALAQLRLKYRVYAQKIAFVFGVVCGQMKSAQYTDYILARNGGKPEKIQAVNYREKSAKGSARDYFYAFKTACGEIRVPQPSDVLPSSQFMAPYCAYCDDVFAECADAVFMDAWLSPYHDDGRGHSLVITRTQAADALLLGLFENKTAIGGKIALKDVVRSQSGVIHKKRVWTTYALRALTRRFGSFGFVRPALMKPGTPYDAAMAVLNSRILRASFHAWRSADGNPARYQKRMRGLLWLNVASIKSYQAVYQTARRLLGWLCRR